VLCGSSPVIPSPSSRSISPGDSAEAGNGADPFLQSFCGYGRLQETWPRPVRPGIIVWGLATIANGTPLPHQQSCSPACDRDPARDPIQVDTALSKNNL